MDTPPRRGPRDEIGGAEQEIREPVLLLLVTEDALVVGMLMPSRQLDPEPLALLSYDSVGVTGVRVRTLEDGRDPEFRGDLERPACPERPSVDDVDLARDPAEASRDDCVVELEAAAVADDPVRDPRASACKRWPDVHAFGKWHVDHTRMTADVSSVTVGAGDLVPCRRADPLGADLVREAVENAEVGTGHRRGCDFGTPL